MVADVLYRQSPMSALPVLYRQSSMSTPPIFSSLPIYKTEQSKFKFNHKKIYYCQRCLNHDTPRPRKNHKCECPYADCTCDKCGLVEKRRILNIRLQNYNTSIENDFDRKSPIDDEDDKKTKGAMTQIGLYPAALTKPFELSLSAIKSVLEPENPSYSKRVPNCQKCGQHGRKSRLKGHKRNCPFRECPCAKCAVVTERQKLMADQIKIRRRQRKDTIMNLTREHITSTINAAAAFSNMSNNQINLNNLNSLLYSAIKTSPQPLLSSPTSSDASSYSPSLQFPSPSIPIIIPPSADHSPTSQTPTTIPCTISSSAPMMAPLPLNPGFPIISLGHQGQEAAFFLQTILDQYRLLEEAASMSISSSPSKDDDSGDEDSDGLNSNSIIDVCSI